LPTSRRRDARSSLTDLAWPVVVLIGLVVLLGAYVQAVVGLGLGLLAAPVVALVEPSLVPVLTLWLALLVSGLNLLDEHEHVDWRSTAWSLPARGPGPVVGAWGGARAGRGDVGRCWVVGGVHREADRRRARRDGAGRGRRHRPHDRDPARA